MFSPPPDVCEKLAALNSTYRLVAQGEQYEEVELPSGDRKPRMTSPRHIRAEIVDLATGEVYASGKDADHLTALRKGLNAARTAPKPLTATQKADPNFISQAERIKQLEAQVASLGGTVEPAAEPEDAPAPQPPPPAKRGRGRSRSAPAPIEPDPNDD